MSELKSVEEKRSIMLALERLENRANQLSDLGGLSETLVDKLQRNMGPKVCDAPNEPVTEPDLIGMIENIAEHIERRVNQIGSNIERAINIIE